MKKTPLANGIYEFDSTTPYAKQRSKVPYYKVIILALTEGLMFTMLIAVGAGHENVQSLIGIKKCSIEFWLLLALVGVVLCFIGFLNCYLIVRSDNNLEKKFQYPADLDFTMTRYIILIITGFFAGTAAGVLGIGSGMVNGPVLLELQLNPQVATTTAAFIIIFTSSSTVCQYLLLGQLPWKLAVWYWPTGFLSGMIGQYIIAYIVKRYKKASIICFLLAGIIASCAVVLVYQGISNVIKKIEDHTSFGFGNYCPNTTALSLDEYTYSGFSYY